jgi:hypothetical protein
MVYYYYSDSRRLSSLINYDICFLVVRGPLVIGKSHELAFWRQNGIFNLFEFEPTN